MTAVHAPVSSVMYNIVCNSHLLLKNIARLCFSIKHVQVH